MIQNKFYCVRLKPSVRIKKFMWPMFFLMNFLLKFANQIEKDIWITSGNDSKHKVNSYHPKDLAYDLRVWNLTKKERSLLVDHLRDNLTENYDTIMEWKCLNKKCGKVFPDIKGIDGIGFLIPNFCPYCGHNRKTEHHIHVEFDQRRYDREH